MSDLYTYVCLSTYIEACFVYVFIFSINFSSSNLSGQEIHGTAGVVYRLVTTFPTSTVLTMERDKLSNFTDILAQATCICAQKASEINSVSMRTKLYCVCAHVCVRVCVHYSVLHKLCIG